MGRGGEKTTGAASSNKTASSNLKMKLDHLQTEELRKWAKAYGLKEDQDRDVLLTQLNPFADGITDAWRPKNLPLERPTFTLSDIKKAIPDHCFKRNLFTSLTHLVYDLTLVTIFGYLATWIGHPMLPAWSSYVLWPIYWACQGCVLTGVWVLAHECGHQAFSESEFINNVFGTVLHSLLLVPYHPWRITHGKHHSNTGSCENDEVFAPATRKDWGSEMLRETPLAQLYGIVIMLTVGWMPGYLVFNATGPAKYRGKNANHFSPEAVFYTTEDRPLVWQSDIAFFACLGAVIYSFIKFGALKVVCFYIIPYMIVNLFLVLITYLQHTDVYMPHFRGEEWNWLRGALCTVDRSFGPVLDHTFHHITDTHVCHHIFSKMPFYNAIEATVHIKKFLGPYYMKDDSPVLHALWRSYSCCQFVEDEGNTVFYKNIK